MNISEIINSGFKGMVIAGLVGTLLACGGGGGGSPVPPQPVVTKGVVTALGSIWVNGVEYQTPPGGLYSDDDSISTTAAYNVGQVVSIRGQRNDDGVSGTADEVEYEAEIEGAALAGAINGVTILTTSNTNVSLAPSLTAGALTDGSRYEVSGFWLDNNTIEATFIKDDDDADVNDEVKGFVEAFTAGSLTVHGVTYTYSGTPAVAVDDVVEIHFIGTVASTVELEEDFFDNPGEGLEVEFEGAVNIDPFDLAACPAGADFLIDLTCIDWDSVNSWLDGLTNENDMVSGLRVEAEGQFDATGLLIADKIKGRGNRVRINATAANVNAGLGTFDVFGNAIQITTQTGLTTIEVGGTNLFSSITNGLGLEIRGIRTGATSVLAVRIKDVSVGPTNHELRAEVDLNGADSLTNNLTVMGITSLVDANSVLNDEGIVIAPGGGLTTEPQIDSYLDSIDDDNVVSTTNGPRDVVQMLIDMSNGGNGTSGSPYSADEVEIEREDD